MRINEITQSPDDIVIEYIKLHCQKYLDEIGGIENALKDHPLWRGVSESFSRQEWARIIPVRQDRRPTNTDPKLQIVIDDWFQSKTGIRFRQSSAFCTGFYGDARSYQSTGGSTPIVLPVGDYDYCWSPNIGDLFIACQRGDSFMTVDEKAYEALEGGDYRFNTDLIEGIQSGNEIMLHCKSVMIINPSWPVLYKGAQ